MLVAGGRLPQLRLGSFGKSGRQGCGDWGKDYGHGEPGETGHQPPTSLPPPAPPSLARSPSQPLLAAGSFSTRSPGPWGGRFPPS